MSKNGAERFSRTAPLFPYALFMPSFFAKMK